MSSEVLDAFQHNAWATRRVLEACRELSEAQLGTSLPTVAGPPLRIMKHVIGAESYYLSLFAESFFAWDWDDAREDSVDALLGFADDLAEAWAKLLSSPVETEGMLSRPRSDGRVMQLKAGVVLAQALHHANVHREQVSSVMTSLGLKPPDISGWAYGDATGTIVR
jgi:uncharacterized damage-inducible protein DinB